MNTKCMLTLHRSVAYCPMGFLCYGFPIILPYTWLYDSHRKGFCTCYRWFQKWVTSKDCLSYLLLMQNTICINTCRLVVPVDPGDCFSTIKTFCRSLMELDMVTVFIPWDGFVHLQGRWYVLSPTKKETNYSDRRFWCSYILFIIIIGGILVLFMYITRLASNEIFSPSNKIHREVGRAKDLSVPRYVYLLVSTPYLTAQCTAVGYLKVLTEIKEILESSLDSGSVPTIATKVAFKAIGLNRHPDWRSDISI